MKRLISILLATMCMTVCCLAAGSGLACEQFFGDDVFFAFDDRRIPLRAVCLKIHGAAVPAAFFFESYIPQLVA